MYGASDVFLWPLVEKAIQAVPKVWNGAKSIVRNNGFATTYGDGIRWHTLVKKPGSGTSSIYMVPEDG